MILIKNIRLAHPSEERSHQQLEKIREQLKAPIHHIKVRKEYFYKNPTPLHLFNVIQTQKLYERESNSNLGLQRTHSVQHQNKYRLRKAREDYRQQKKNASTSKYNEESAMLSQSSESESAAVTANDTSVILQQKYVRKHFYSSGVLFRSRQEARRSNKNGTSVQQDTKPQSINSHFSNSAPGSARRIALQAFFAERSSPLRKSNEQQQQSKDFRQGTAYDLIRESLEFQLEVHRRQVQRDTSQLSALKNNQNQSLRVKISSETSQNSMKSNSWHTQTAFKDEQLLQQPQSVTKKQNQEQNQQQIYELLHKQVVSPHSASAFRQAYRSYTNQTRQQLDQQQRAEYRRHQQQQQQQQQQLTPSHIVSLNNSQVVTPQQQGFSEFDFLQLQRKLRASVKCGSLFKLNM